MLKWLILLFIFLLSIQTAVAVDIGPFFSKQITNEEIKGFSISTHGEYISVTSEDNRIYFFDKDVAAIWNTQISDGLVRDVATNGNFIVAGYSVKTDSASMDREYVRLYSKSMDILFDKYLQYFSSPIRHVAVSTDGNTIVASSPRQVYILDGSGNIKYRLPVAEMVFDVALSPNGEFLAVSSGNAISLYDGKGKTLGDFKVEQIKGVSISNDSRIAVLTPHTIFLYLKDKKLWEKTAKSGNLFTSVSISPDGNWIASGSVKELLLFDKNGVEVLRYQADFKYVYTDGVLIAGVKNAFLYLFDARPFETGAVSILSTQGAEVYLDEKFMGKVPLTIPDVAVGAHTIRISRAGYESWVQDIDISYGDKKEISLMLAPALPAPVTSTQDVVIIPKSYLYFIILGAVLIAIPAVYLKRGKKSSKFYGISSLPVKISSKYEPFIGGNCPYCGDILKANSMITVCSDCETPHHIECWERHGGCTTFGCNRAP